MFSNKTIFISGASSGLGQSLAIALSQQNANLILFARDRANLEKTARACSQPPLLVQGDVTHSTQCAQAIVEGVDHFGQLDYLILNAGISMWSPFADLESLSMITQLMQTNYLGAVNCTFPALPYLKKTQGMIVVISSIQGKIGVPCHAGYAGSKHALQGFFDSLRMELSQDKIKILSVCPGWIANTALKQHALRAFPKQPEAQLTSRASAIPLEVCVSKIIKAMQHMQRELILPRHYRWIPWLKLICPGFLDWLIAKQISLQK